MSHLLSADDVIAYELDRDRAVVELATLLSLSVRIEPELLRAVRLDVAPYLHAGVEADLWFSSLVASRGPDGIAFHPQVAALLRQRLRDCVKPEMVERVWKITRRLHENLSPALALEERIAWDALLGGSTASAAIEDELRSVLVTLVEQRRPGVARWVAQAWPRLPVQARATATAWQLKEAAGPYLGTYRIRSAAEAPKELGEVDLRAVVEHLADVPLALRRIGGVLELGQIEREGAIAIRVPATDPRLVELTWTKADQSWSELVQVRPGAAVQRTVGFGLLRFRTARGVLYELSGRPPPAVFYAGGDEASMAQQIIAALIERGFRMGRADSSRPLPSGSDGVLDAQAWAANADILILFFTRENSQSTFIYSTFIDQAWRNARSQGKPVLLVMLGVEASTLPEELRDLQSLDLDGVGLNDAVAHLAAEIDQATRVSPGTSEPPFPTEKGDTRARLPHWEITFDRDGEVLRGGAKLRNDIESGEFTDLLVLAHGWNNSQVTAASLYRRLRTLLIRVLDNSGDVTNDAGLGVVEIFWPSILWSDDPQTADSEGLIEALKTVYPEPEQQPLVSELAELLKEAPVDSNAVARARELIEQLAQSGLGSDEAEGAEERRLLQEKLTRSLSTGTTEGHPSSRGPSRFTRFRQSWLGFKDMARTLSYSRMEYRAEVIGEQGVGPLLAGLVRRSPGLRIHLIGHSVGARLVSYALLGLPEYPVAHSSPVKSLVLLQATLPQYAFAENLPARSDRNGPLQPARTRVDGPLVATYSKADTFLGTYWPILAALTRIEAGRDDAGRYGAVGHNGVQGVLADTIAIAPVGAGYGLPIGKFTNIDCSSVIAGGAPPSGAHGDIAHPELSWLILSAAGHVLGTPT